MPVSRSKQKETIDERILRIIGLEDIFDIDYETYLTLLKEAMVKARMPRTKLSTEESDLLLDEYRRVRSKKDKGRFEVKKKKITTSTLRGIPATKQAAKSKPVRKLSPAKEKTTAITIAGGGGKYSPQLESDVASILVSVTSILGTLKAQQSFLRNRTSGENRRLEKERRSKRESSLESKQFNPLKKVVDRILSPVKNILGGILDFFVNMFLGRIFIKLIDWMADPNNRKKLTNTFRFLSNFWPVFAAAALGFGTGLVGFAGKLISVLGGFTVKLLSLAPRLAAAARFGRFGAAGKLGAAAGLFTFGAWGPEVFPGLTGDDKGGEGFGLSGGGLVPGVDFSNIGYGFGPVGTDTVPAMLSPGEFVMSKGAVDLLGSDVLAQLNSLGGGTNKPRQLSGLTYAAGGGYINRRNRGSGFGSPAGGYPDQINRDSDLVKLAHRFIPGAKHIVGHESTLNKTFLGKKIDRNTAALQENTRVTRENTSARRSGGGRPGRPGSNLGSLGSGILGLAEGIRNNAGPAFRDTVKWLATNNPLALYGAGLEKRASQASEAEKAIAKLTEERIKQGLINPEGKGLTYELEKKFRSDNDRIQGMFAPGHDLYKNVGKRNLLQRFLDRSRGGRFLQNTYADIQNKGLVRNPLLELLKTEQSEKFVEKITAGRFKNFGATITGGEMALKGLAGPLGRFYRIEDQGSMGRYLRPAMMEAQRRGHSSVGNTQLGQALYDKLLPNKMANLAFGRFHFNVDSKGRARVDSGESYDASELTPEGYHKQARQHIVNFAQILQGKKEGNPIGELFNAFRMNRSAYLATGQNKGLTNLKPIGLGHDLGKGFLSTTSKGKVIPKMSTEQLELFRAGGGGAALDKGMTFEAILEKGRKLKGREIEHRRRVALGSVFNQPGSKGYYSSTTGQFYSNYNQALQDPRVNAGHQLELAKQQLSGKRTAPPPMSPIFNSKNVTVVNASGAGAAKPGDPKFIGPVPGNDKPAVKATPSGWDWARQQVMNVLGMGG